MYNRKDQIFYSDKGKYVRIVSGAYVFKPDQQYSKYTKIDSGTVGVVELRRISAIYNIEHYLVTFNINGEQFHGKLARSMIQFL